MRVCIATDDFLHVKRGHFGDARYYAAYERGERGEWRLAWIAENPYAGVHEHGGGEEGKRRRIYEMVSGCDIIVATFFGPGGREYMESRGLRVVTVSPGTTLLEALEASLGG